MNKIFYLFALLILVSGALLGPSWVQAQHPQDLDLSALSPDPKQSGDFEITSIHPAWKKIGLIPTCLD